MRAPIHRNRAMPPLALQGVIEHRDGTGRLHNAPVTAYYSGGEVRHVCAQATHAKTVILDLVRAIDAPNRAVVERVVSSFGRHRVVRPALAAAPMLFARFRRPDQIELPLAQLLLA